MLRSYAVLQRLVPPGDGSPAIVRLGTVTATTREKAWEQVQHEPDAWVGEQLHVGDVVELGLIPESAWPEFKKLGARPRLQVVE